MSQNRRFFSLPPFKAGCLLIFLSCLLFYSFGNEKPLFLSSIDHRIMDMMFRLRGPEAATGELVIVDIDERSLRELGQWPWPRKILAALTARIHESGAKALGFDIVFAEADRTSPVRTMDNLDPALRRKIPDDIFSLLADNPGMDYDLRFGNAVAKGPTILGYTFQMKDDGLKQGSGLPLPSARIRVLPENTEFGDLALFRAYRAILNISPVARAQSEGFFNVSTDASGTVRQVPLLIMMDGIPYPSLALEMCRVGKGFDTITIHASDRIHMPRRAVLGIGLKHRFLPTDRHGRLFVNFRGPENSFPHVSAADLLEGKKTNILHDKMVLVGSSASGLFDLRATPFSSTVAGVEINANIIDNLLKQDPFVYDIYTEIGITYVLVVSGGLLLTCLLCLFGPLTGAFAAGLFFFLVLAGDYFFLFLDHQHVGITYPMATCLCILMTVSILNYFQEGKARKYIQDAFGHYVAPEVVARLIRDPEALSLKGEQKELTILFCDIREFTAISERMNSRELGWFMNEFLTGMSRVIMENGGTVDKFIGDAIMAFWGAPETDADHAAKAVRAAMLMKKKLEDMRPDFQKRQMPEIVVGIGIHTGMVSVGNFGSNERFDYTAMGDAVNLASRLEGINRYYGTEILISGYTRGLLGKQFACRYVDRLQVKGRSQWVDIYEPIEA